jgi:hypothetical protein
MGNVFIEFLKIIGKLILVLIWGACHLAELTLKQINSFLKSIINKK